MVFSCFDCVKLKTLGQGGCCQSGFCKATRSTEELVKKTYCISCRTSPNLSKTTTLQNNKCTISVICIILVLFLNCLKINIV